MIRAARTLLCVVFCTISGLSSILVGLGAVVTAVQFLGLDRDANAPPVGASVIALVICALVGWAARRLAEWLEPHARDNPARFDPIR
jgi:hypothetical protein